MKTRINIAVLLPAVFAALFIVDIGLRFTHLEFLSFRAWESVGRFRAATGPEAPNYQYKSDRCFGDLASMGNLRKLRHYREEVFTTDSFGYRNPSTLTPPLKYINAGNSFGAGMGVSDSEALSSRLGEYLRKPVYNAAGYALNPIRIKRLAERLQANGGVLIYEQLQRLDYSNTADFTAGNGMSARRKEFFENEKLRSVGIFLQDFLAVSPLAALATQGMKHITEGNLLPNPYENLVIERKLKNGESILFLPTEVDASNADKKARAGEKFFLGLKEELEKFKIRLVVILVPDKLSVYGPLLQQPPVSLVAADEYFALLKNRLQKQAIPTFNLTELFRKQAAEQVTKGKYIYFLDDTHWNAEGISLAAQAVKNFLSTNGLTK